MTMFYDREFANHLVECRYSLPFSWLDCCLGVRMVASWLVGSCYGHLVL
jgi:hypothetical protein